MQTAKDYDFLYKIVIAGEAGVGKTHLLSKYIKGTLPENPTSTIGVEFATMLIPLPSGSSASIHFWDTAGLERYRAISLSHYRRSIGALLVYDITNEESFIACDRWMKDIRDHTESDVIIMLVGNKLDLVENNGENRKVLREIAENFAKENSLLFQETSTFTGENVKEVFEELVLKIYQIKSQERETCNRESKVKILVASPQTNIPTKSCCY
jgi:Rab family protein